MAGCWGDDGKWHDECSGAGDAYPANGTAAEQSAWLKAHGYGTGQNTGPNTLLPPGWVINPETGGLIPPGPGMTGGGGIPVGGFFDVNGTVYQWNGHGSLVQASVGETKSYWNQHPNGLSYNPSYGLLDGGTQGATNTYGGGTSGGSGGGSSTRLSTDDPRYWDLEYAKLNSSDKQAADQLAYQYTQLGQTAENARRSALMAFIQARDSLATNTAQTSANIAEAKAKFAANPRDTYAEALYRNQVGGSTPFGDLNNTAFGQYGKTLAEKGIGMFQNVNADLEASRRYRDALPLNDWLPADLRGAGQPTGSPAAPIPADAVGANPLASFAGASPEQLAAINHIADQANPLRSFVGASPEQLAAIKQIDLQRQQTAASPTPQGPTTPPMKYGKGGTIDFGQLTRFGAPQPSSTEGGLNLNIHELAHIVGKSGHVYATLGEGGYPEQVKITPTPSGKKAAMEAEKAGKVQKDVMGKAFGQGGTIGADPSLDDMNAQYSQLLQRLGGMGGGSSTPLGGARFLAGAPTNAIQDDPYLKGITEASYSMKGIDPSELWAQVAKFQIPGVVNNSPHVSFA